MNLISAINQPWRFNGDGLLSFNPILRPIQLPWLNALSIRTRQQDTFLMSVLIGQNNSIIISVRIKKSYFSNIFFLKIHN